MTSSFAVTWDYRCPFARNAHEHLLTGLAAGADWELSFVPFSLGQVHVEEGQPSVWEKPEQDGGIVALQAGVVVRDEYPDLFPEVHRALFAARHDEALKLDNPQVTRDVLRAHGIDDEQAVFVRLIPRAPRGADAAESIRTVERVVELLGWPELNEFKHTSIPR